MACCNFRDTFVSPVVKYVLFFFNFVFWVIGGVMIGIGVWAYVEKNKFYHNEVQSVYDVIFDLAIIFFVIGFIIFVLGYAGCIGALRENVCCLKFFYLAMITIFLLEVVGAVLVFVFKDKVKEKLTEVLHDNLIESYMDDLDKRDVIDWIQENLQCCGVNGYEDWNKNMYFNCTAGNKSRLRCSVPWPCCKKPDTLMAGVPNILCGSGILDDTTHTDIIHTTGCVSAALQLAESNLPILGGIAIGFAVPQLVGICLARLLEGQILDQLARWQYQQ